MDDVRQQHVPLVADIAAVGDRNVQADSVVFAAKNVKHQIRSSDEDLTLRVFYASEEYSKR